MLEHRFAQLTFAATFLLLLVGGTVNPTGSSLACPEALFVCHGQWFPKLTGGVLYEHGHRLVAMTVGLLQIALTALLWLRLPALRGLGAAALVMVCVQGGLGALTVHVKLHWVVSTAHLLMALAYLAVLLTLVWLTRRPRRVSAEERAGAARARPWIVAAAAVVLVQILLGGLVRHHGAALASIDLPLHEGSLWPAGAPLALKLHMAHRLFGVITALVVISAAALVLLSARRCRALRVMALCLPILVLGQVALGVLVIASFREVPVAVAHFGGAALLWALLFSMWLTSGQAQPAPARGAAAIAPAMAGEAVSG
jgi:heme a synthase